MTDPLERVLRPIVEGQIRSFLNDHPETVNAVTWYRKRADRKQTLINSMAKRILRDCLCSENRARIVSAALELSAGAPDE